MSRQLIKWLDRFLGRTIAHVCLLIRPLLSERVVQTRGIRKILVIRPGGIGDAILLLPALRVLRSVYPDAELYILAEKRNVEVFHFSPFQRVFCYDRRGDLFRALRQHYDLVIDTEQWHRFSAVAAFLTRAPIRLGFATNERRHLFTHSTAYSHQEYEVESFLNLIALVTGVRPVFNPEAPFIQIPDGMRAWAKDRLQGMPTPKRIAFFPGASVRERQWGVQKFSELASRLAEKGYGILIVGGNSDEKEAGEIARSFENRVLNLAGSLSLPQTAAVLAEADLLVTADSGLMHMACAVGTPTVSLFGAGIEKKWAPRGKGHRVLNRDLPCSPCTRFGYTPSCPIEMECLRRIGVPEVEQVVCLLLEGPPHGSKTILVPPDDRVRLYPRQAGKR